MSGTIASVEDWSDPSQCGNTLLAVSQVNDRLQFSVQAPGSGRDANTNCLLPLETLPTTIGRHHIVVMNANESTFSRFSIYVDGVAPAGTANLLPAGVLASWQDFPDARLHLGRAVGGTSWDGYVLETAFYAEALTQQDVVSKFELGPPNNAPYAVPFEVALLEDGFVNFTMTAFDYEVRHSIWQRSLSMPS